MPAVGSFLANMLLGGLQEGQRRREVQTTVLPHLLNLMATQQYHTAILGLRGQEDVVRRETAEATVESKRLADREKAARLLSSHRFLYGAFHPVTEQDIDEYLAKQGIQTSRTSGVSSTSPSSGSTPSQEQVGHITSDVSERIRQRLLRFRP